MATDLPTAKFEALATLTGVRTDIADMEWRWLYSIVGIPGSLDDMWSWALADADYIDKYKMLADVVGYRGDINTMWLDYWLSYPGQGVGAVALPAQTFRLGIYPFPDNIGSPSHIATSETYIGAGYDTMRLFRQHSAWSGYGSAMSSDYTPLLNAGRAAVFAVGLTANDGDFDAVIAGTHDAKWTAEFQVILAAYVAGGDINIDLGWEANNDNYPWRWTDGVDGSTLTVNLTKAGKYKQAYQRVVGLARSVSSRFKFGYTPNFARYDQVNMVGIDPELAYPGNSYVDWVGLDWYQPSSGDSDGALWNNLRSGFGIGYGLDWLVTYAAAKGKPMFWPEFALMANRGGVLDLAMQFAHDNGLALATYWDSEDTYDGRFSDGSAGTTGTRAIVWFGPPAITSAASASVVDGAALSWTLTASKPVTWQIIGGADAAKFSIVGSTLSMTAKSYAAPEDAGGNNVYDVKIRAVDDRQKYVTQDFAATVVQPWTPTALGANVAGWWDASDVSTLIEADDSTAESGDAIKTWNSKAGSFGPTQAAAGSRPTYSATALNSLPGVTFDGSNDHFVFTPPANFPDGAEPGTFVIVGDVSNLDEGTFQGKTVFMYGTNSSNQFRQFQRRGTGQLAAYFGADSNSAIDWSGNTRIGIHRQNPTGDNTHRWNVDGATTDESTAAVTLATTLVNGRIGCSLAGTSFWPGTIQEMLMIDKALSTDERQKMEGYLAHKWALTGQLPSGHPYKSVRPGV